MNKPIPFKQQVSFDERLKESMEIRSRYPSRVPVIVERYTKEMNLPLLDKIKILAPKDVSMSLFMGLVRRRMSLAPAQALYLIVNNRNLPSMSKTISELYEENKDEDGFLYMVYASQEVFG